MNEILVYVIIGILCLLVGYIISRAFFGLKLGNLQKDFQNEKNLLESNLGNVQNQMEEQKRLHLESVRKIEEDYTNRLESAEKEREQIRSEKEELSTKLASQITEFKNLEEKLQTQKTEVEELQQKFQKEFENLANKILDQKSEKFTSLNKQNLETILNPLKEKISGFEKKVEDSEKESIKRHSELGEQLKNLNEQNQKIGEEALNLTRALKGNAKTQGNWGEMILERVLELSGLQKDKEYKTQESFVNDHNQRRQPDVVVYLPGDKRMIIDSKVSLNAYERYVNSSAEPERQQHLKDHLLSVRKHVDELSEKNYQQFFQSESPDFVLLFIPVEAAFAVASQEYPKLYSDAFDKKIIIVTPTTLLAVLKTIDSMWQNERQNQNALEIAYQAGKLYDSFVNLIEEFEKVGRQFNTAQNTYDNAMKKLTGRGNLLIRVENLKKLGAKTSKQIDPKLLDEFENEEIGFEDEQ
ncbi:MAG: DNA recombination protein RmuC [Moheibacter sp.]